MAVVSHIQGDQIVSGQQVVNSLVIKTPCLTPANLLTSLLSFTHQQIGTVAALSEIIHIVRGTTATLKALKAFVTTKATGADRTVSVDLQKSTGGGAFATILTTPLVFDDDSTDLIETAAAIANASLVAGDKLKIVVTVAGVASAQAIGLGVTVHLEEATS